MKVILASSSPRREQILKEIIRDFEIVPPDVDERVDFSNPLEAVKELSFKKASVVYDKHPDCLIISADTVVVYNGVVFGKPKFAVNAFEMLSRLSGNTHLVYTAVTVMKNGKADVFADISQVTFRKLTEDQIKDYIASGSPFDKAGGYGIQDSDFVQKIVGSYSNVMGLPKERLLEYFRSIGEENVDL